jgi:signal transduction histidine kinase/CheY-like chemotaxis protein
MQADPSYSPTAPKSESLRELQVRSDLIASIYSHIPRSSLGVVAGALTVSWGMWGQIAHAWVIAWLGAIGAVILWRLALHQAFARSSNVTARVARWEQYWTLSTGVHGSIWGSTAIIMYIPGSPEYQALLLVALFALSTAAVPLIGRHLPSLYAFVLPVLLPIILRLGFEGGAIRVLLAIISALVMYGIFLFGAELNRTITESVRRRYENLDLIEELRIQTAQAESARREADHANRMKTRFLAAASHDLRQPMHALGLFSDSLRRRITEPSQSAIAERICESVDSLEKTFDALLDISRLDAGVVQAKPQSFALQPLFDRVAGDCGPEAAAKGIALRFHPTKLATLSDPVLVEQILRNLVNNAIRYTDRGKVLVGCRMHGEAVCIEVWDTGHGISADKQARIFDEFYQGDERDRRKGLGLGLAIVRRVADLLATKIELRSRPGRGSVFRFKLHRCQGTVMQQESVGLPTALEARPLGDAVVLVIDDDPSVLDAMREALHTWGVRAVTARSLECALARLPDCGRYPDAIVSDFRLSEARDGIDAVRRIRHELGLCVPAMVITGDTSPKSLRAIEQSGLTYLPKPVTAERMRSALAELIDQGKSASSVTATSHVAC